AGNFMPGRKTRLTRVSAISRAYSARRSYSVTRWPAPASSMPKAVPQLPAPMISTSAIRHLGLFAADTRLRAAHDSTDIRAMFDHHKQADQHEKDEAVVV